MRFPSINPARAMLSSVVNNAIANGAPVVAEIAAPAGMLSAQQRAWAASHDWFACENDDGTISVHDYSWGENRTINLDTYVWRGTFRELRAWAGY